MRNFALFLNSRQLGVPQLNFSQYPVYCIKQPRRLLTCQHRLVLETLSPLPQDRKCFRMINGVLVERTVKDVMPALATNSEGLKKVLDDLVKQYKRQQEEMEQWKVCVTVFI